MPKGLQGGILQKKNLIGYHKKLLSFQYEWVKK